MIYSLIFASGFVSGILLCVFIALFEAISHWKIFLDQGDRRSVVKGLERKLKPFIGQKGAIIKSYDDQAWLNEIPKEQPYDRSRDQETS